MEGPLRILSTAVPVAGAADSHDEHSTHSMHISSQVLFFGVMALLVGQLLKHFANVTKIPYTPIICVMGIIAALISEFRSLDIMEKAVSKMDPGFMLFLFLPALIFESAFSTDWHTFTV